MTRRWRLCSSSHFSATEPNFTLALESIVSPQRTSERTQLACHVTNITHLAPGGRLGVDWEHTALAGNVATPSIAEGKERVKHVRYALTSAPTRRNRRRTSDVTSHWLPGQPGQPVARAHVLGAAEEWRGLSEQNPAQHLQTSLSPNTGNAPSITLLCVSSLMKPSLIPNKC